MLIMGVRVLWLWDLGLRASSSAQPTFYQGISIELLFYWDMLLFNADLINL